MLVGEERKQSALVTTMWDFVEKQRRQMEIISCALGDHKTEYKDLSESYKKILNLVLEELPKGIEEFKAYINMLEQRK